MDTDLDHKPRHMVYGKVSAVKEFDEVKLYMICMILDYLILINLELAYL